MPAERERIGRYEILTRLGGGGMAELFLAFFDGPGGFRKYVALKRILPHLRREQAFVSMFLDEARISAALSHSNIAQVFDLGQDGEDLFIALEFIPGHDASRILREAVARTERLPVGLACTVVRDVCLALHYAHGFTSASGKPQPLIHRDVSPRNVMVTYSGQVKLIDFGIAKAKGSLSQTRQGQLKGSLLYMSPEQYRGEELSPQSDLFSAGAMLYELLTGVGPFRGPDEASVLYNVLEKDPAPPQELNSGISPALGEVVLKALSKDREKRYATGREMAQAIAAAEPNLFGEEQVGAYMSSRFAEALRATRELLALAGDEGEEAFTSAVERLQRVVDQGSGQGPKTSGRTKITVVGTPVPLTPQPTVSGSTILVIDDSKVLRAVLEQLLTREGYHVLAAPDGTQALEIVRELSPDLIVLDVVMPDLDGFEVCTRMRALPPLRDTPIIFLSAACELDERARGLAAGGDDFIRKPFEGPDLITRVRDHLLRARALKARSV